MWTMKDAENTAPAVGTTLVEATNSLMDSAQSEEVPEVTQAATIATLQIGDTNEDEAQDTAETSVPEQTEVQPISSKEMDTPTDTTTESPASADLTLGQSNTTAEEKYHNNRSHRQFSQCNTRNRHCRSPNDS